MANSNKMVQSSMETKIPTAATVVSKKVTTAPSHCDLDGLFDTSKLHYKMHPNFTPIRTWTYKDIEFTKSVYLLLAHIGAIYGLYKFLTGQVHLYTFLLALIMYAYGGLGITAGAHRLWTHRSYEAKAPLQIFLMICNSVAHQGSIFHWSRDHVLHHKFSESIADPHDARRGFFFSHMGWLLVKKQPEITIVGQTFSFSWLKKNSIVMFQHKNYFLISHFFCFILPAYISSSWNDGFNGLMFAGFFRYVWTLHCTWTVNSLAHLIGERPYDKDISPSESLATALLSHGEGWHNYHHTYPYDYACSEFGISAQYNPTKFFIDCCWYLGLATNLKRRNEIEKKEY